jgi:hypothetical protein
VSGLEDLRQLEPQFYRAPSAHNAQPWQLHYAADRVELVRDPARELLEGDPTQRDLYLSLGAFVEAVLISAAAVGVGLRFEPGGDPQPLRVGTFLPAEELYETPFTSADLERRQTSRLEYDPGRLGADELAAARGQLGVGAELHEIPTRDLVGLASAADRHLWESPEVVEELRRWLRLSRRHPRYAEDGLSYDCLGLSRLQAAAAAVLLQRPVYRLVRGLGLHRAFMTTASLLEREGSALVLVGAAETKEDVLTQGRTLLRVWLAIAQRGLYTHPLSQILDCPETERELASRVGVAPGRGLLSIFRVGRSKPPARSHRLASGN